MYQDEVCGLKWSQVSIQRREVRLTTTNTSSPRVVPLSDTTLGTLVGTPRHITSPYVFWHGAGHRYTYCAERFRQMPTERMCQADAMTCDTILHPSSPSEPQDQLTLQTILGHNTTAMEMRHSHLMTEHLHRPMIKDWALAGTNFGTSSADLKG